MKNILPPLFPFLVGVFVIEFLVKTQLVPQYILPPPTAVLNSLVSDFSEYKLACQETLGAAFAGLILAGITGVIVALVLSSSKIVEQAFFPYATFFQTVPIVSIAPLLVIWFGFGIKTVIISAFIVSIFPVIASTLAGLKSVDTSLIELFRLYGASKTDLLFKLKLPSAVPQIVTGLKISAGLAMIGAVIGEFIAGGGLGGIIDASRTQQRLDKVFAAVLLASFAGLLIVFIINSISKQFLKKWSGLR